MGAAARREALAPHPEVRLPLEEAAAQGRTLVAIVGWVKAKPLAASRLGWQRSGFLLAPF